MRCVREYKKREINLGALANRSEMERDLPYARYTAPPHNYQTQNVTERKLWPLGAVLIAIAIFAALILIVLFTGRHGKPCVSQQAQGAQYSLNQLPQHVIYMRNRNGIFLGDAATKQPLGSIANVKPYTSGVMQWLPPNNAGVALVNAQVKRCQRPMDQRSSGASHSVPATSNSNRNPNPTRANGAASQSVADGAQAPASQNNPTAFTLCTSLSPCPGAGAGPSDTYFLEQDVKFNVRFATTGRSNGNNSNGRQNLNWTSQTRVFKNGQLVGTTGTIDGLTTRVQLMSSDGARVLATINVPPANSTSFLKMMTRPAATCDIYNLHPEIVDTWAVCFLATCIETGDFALALMARVL